MLSYPVRIALIAALGGFLFGFETVVISGAEETLQKIWTLSPFAHGFTVASSLLGTILGALTASIPANRYGRKKVLQAIAVMFIVAAIGCASVSAWALFIFFRIIGGLAVGASSMVAPMYISEIAPAALRGRLAGSFQVNIVTGIMIAFLTNYFLKDIGENAWRWMFGVMLVPAVIFWILLRVIPESPRWLIINGYTDKAAPVMIKLGEPDVPKAIVKIQQSLHEQKSGAVGEHKEPLFQRRYAKPMAYAMLLAMFNQLSGINAILYYAPRIFEMAGFDKSHSFGQSVYVGAANLFFTLLAMTLIDRFGRKKLLLIGSIGMAVFLALTAHAFSAKGGGSSMVVEYLIGFIAFFAFSQGAVIWVFISEIFPNSVRSQGGSLGSTTHWVMAAIISWIFPIIVQAGKGQAEGIMGHVHPNTTGVFYSFAFFSVMMLLQLIFVWRALPETKGRTLEDIQKDLGIQ